MSNLDDFLNNLLCPNLFPIGFESECLVSYFPAYENQLLIKYPDQQIELVNISYPGDYTQYFEFRESLDYTEYGEYFLGANEFKTYGVLNAIELYAFKAGFINIKVKFLFNKFEKNNSFFKKHFRFLALQIVLQTRI